MFQAGRIAHVVTTVVVATCLFAVAGEARPQEGKRADVQIYQQRTADGRVVFTDRPVAGAVTQRTWQTTPEDAVAAHQRREEARLEALAVDERIQRRLEAQRQRDHELDLARVQLAAASARRDEERARADETAEPPVVFVRGVVPWRFPRPPHHAQARTPVRRPGLDATGSPR